MQVVWYLNVVILEPTVKVHIVVFWIKTSCSLMCGYIGFNVMLPPHRGYIYNIWGCHAEEDAYCVILCYDSV
jgi:hypothetical protein